MGKTLSEIFENECRKLPQMTYVSRVRIEYVGDYRISAIRAIRKVTGLSLKSAKDVIEWSGGFEISAFAYAAIVEEYLTDAMHMGAHGKDWREINERPEPIKL